MSVETISWLRVAHVLGIVLWVGGLLMELSLLQVHAKLEAAARPVLTPIEKRMAMLMDLGATLAIAAGLTLALGKTPNAFVTGPWLHVKLTIVTIAILGSHGFVRVKIKKFSRGEIKPLPSWLFAVVLLGTAAAIALGANPSLLRR